MRAVDFPCPSSRARRTWAMMCITAPIIMEMYLVIPHGAVRRTRISIRAGLPIPIDPGTTDLGDDVYRDADNHGSSLGDTPRPADVDPGSGLPIRIDPGTLDLGDDVYRA